MIYDHYLIEFYETPNIGWTETLAAFDHAVQSCGLHIIGTQSHRFENGALSAVYLLSESHVSIHTWPEEGRVCADLFTCDRKNSQVQARLFFDELKQSLTPLDATIQMIGRGR